MVRLLIDGTNTFVIDSKGFDKSVTYTASFFGKMTKTTQSVVLTDISTAESTWLRFELIIPDNINLVAQEYSLEIKREDDKIISKTIATAYEIESELQSYNNDKKYTQYNKD